MNIIEAMKVVKIHPWPKVRRKAWRAKWYVSFSGEAAWLYGPGNPVRDSVGAYRPELEDVLSEDWEVVEKL